MTKFLSSLALATFLFAWATPHSLAQEQIPFYGRVTTISDVDRTMPPSPKGPRLLGYGVALISTEDEPTGSIDPVSSSPCNTGSNAQDSTDCSTLVELVQVGSFRNQHEAEKEAARFAQEHSTTLGALVPGVKQAIIGPDGEVYYRLRYSGFRSQNVPTKICSQLKNKGEQCLPLQR